MDVEQICSRLAAVRRNHLLFGEIDEAPEPDGEPAQAKPKQQHARPAARSGEGSELTSRSQQIAQKRFYDIDVGKLDAQSVFERVAGAPDRVNTKLCFFRDRPDLVLPIIEEKFIVRDEKMDCEVLDLPRLRGAQSARTPRTKVQAVPSSASLKTLLSEDDAVYDSAEEKHLQDSPQGQKYLSVAEPRTLQHVLSMASVNTRPSEHSSLETGEQRSLRIVRAARIRDERIQIAQRAVRSNELQWRLHHYKCFRDKEQRKDCSWKCAFIVPPLRNCYTGKMAVCYWLLDVRCPERAATFVLHTPVRKGVAIVLCMLWNCAPATAACVAKSRWCGFWSLSVQAVFQPEQVPKSHIHIFISTYVVCLYYVCLFACIYANVYACMYAGG